MDVFEAIADPTRREIIALLATSERSAGDIAGRFDIAGPSVSRHLKVLRESGVISFRQEAQTRIYRLETAALGEVEQWMRAQIDVVRERFDRLGTHLDAMKKRETRHAKRRTR
jgi:DNA-binding transcriptional ArsR family regulator